VRSESKKDVNPTRGLDTTKDTGESHRVGQNSVREPPAQHKHKHPKRKAKKQPKPTTKMSLTHEDTDDAVDTHYKDELRELLATFMANSVDNIPEVLVDGFCISGELQEDHCSEVVSLCSSPTKRSSRPPNYHRCSSTRATQHQLGSLLQKQHQGKMKY